MLKFILPLPLPSYSSYSNLASQEYALTALLVHPHQPLSYLEGIIVDEVGKASCGAVSFRSDVISNECGTEHRLENRRSSSIRFSRSTPIQELIQDAINTHTAGGKKPCLIIDIQYHTNTRYSPTPSGRKLLSISLQLPTVGFFTDVKTLSGRLKELEEQLKVLSAPPTKKVSYLKAGLPAPSPATKDYTRPLITGTCLLLAGAGLASQAGVQVEELPHTALNYLNSKTAEMENDMMNWWDTEDSMSISTVPTVLSNVVPTLLPLPLQLGIVGSVVLGGMMISGMMKKWGWGESSSTSTAKAAMPVAATASPFQSQIESGTGNCEGQLLQREVENFGLVSWMI